MKNMLFQAATLAEITRAMEGERTRAGKKFTINGNNEIAAPLAELRRIRVCGRAHRRRHAALWTREEQEMLIRILTHRTITQRRRGEAEEYPA